MAAAGEIRYDDAAATMRNNRSGKRKLRCKSSIAAIEQLLDYHKTGGNKRAAKHARADTEVHTRERETGVFCAVKCDVLSCDLNFESLFGEDFFVIPETALSFGHGRRRNRNFCPIFLGKDSLVSFFRTRNFVRILLVSFFRSLQLCKDFIGVLL